MTFTAAVGTALKKGYDITNAHGAAGVVDSGSGSSANIIVENGMFGTGPTGTVGVDDANPYGGADVLTVAAGGIKSVPQYNLYRGEAATIRPSLSTGDNVTYRIVPGSPYTSTLPAGLALNATTGIISGTATQPFSTAEFQLEARNTVGTATHEFKIQVLDAFFLENLTDNALSYKLHKSGRGRQTTNCRISSAQLNTTSYLASKDIICLLDAGELDLYDAGMNLKASFGAGMCNFISIRPYQFYKFEYKKTGQHTPKTYYKYSVDATNCTGNCYDPKTGNNDPCGGLTDDIIPTSGACDSTYTSPANPTYPNCDDGFSTTITTVYTRTAPAGDCTVQGTEAISTPVETACGGLRSNCINGPAKDMYGAQLEDNVVSTIYPAGSGGSQSWTFASPMSKGYWTNMYLANFAIKNSCHSDSGSDADNFVYYGNSWQKYADDTFYQVKLDTATGSTAGGGFNPGLDVSTAPGALSYTVFAVVDDNTLIVKPVTGTLADLNATTTLTIGGQNILNFADTGKTNAVVAYDSPQRRSQPYYDINCLNASYDTIARIRLLVREWNRAFDSTSRIDRIRPDLALTNIPDFMDVFYDAAPNDHLDEFFNDYNNRRDWDFYTPNLTTCGASVSAPVAPIAPRNPTNSTPYTFINDNL